MRKYIISIFNHFEWSDLNPGRKIREGLLVFFAWAGPSLLFVLWATLYFPEVEFYHKAIDEGIGPNLWNVIGSFGIFLFGASIVFAHWRTLSRVTEVVLNNTYAIGCLSFGLLTGQWLFLPYSELTWWQSGLFGVTSFFLLLIVLVLNFVIWYLGFLVKAEIQKRSAFWDKLQSVPWYVRTIIGSLFSIVIVILFLNA